jgi:hypothetical protein
MICIGLFIILINFELTRDLALSGDICAQGRNVDQKLHIIETFELPAFWENSIVL